MQKRSLWEPKWLFWAAASVVFINVQPAAAKAHGKAFTALAPHCGKDLSSQTLYWTQFPEGATVQSCAICHAYFSDMDHTSIRNFTVSIVFSDCAIKAPEACHVSSMLVQGPQQLQCSQLSDDTT